MKILNIIIHLLAWSIDWFCLGLCRRRLDWKIIYRKHSERYNPRKNVFQARLNKCRRHRTSKFHIAVKSLRNVIERCPGSMLPFIAKGIFSYTSEITWAGDKARNRIKCRLALYIRANLAVRLYSGNALYSEIYTYSWLVHFSMDSLHHLHHVRSFSTTELRIVSFGIRSCFETMRRTLRNSGLYLFRSC